MRFAGAALILLFTVTTAVSLAWSNHGMPVVVVILIGLAGLLGWLWKTKGKSA